jgi:branched-chain amino acid transport system ATP-binding protein
MATDRPFLDGAHLNVEPGKVHCIIGPNGAGKSTLLKAICGMLKIRKGDVTFKGKSLKGLRPDQVLRKGICFVPQERALFPKMTVRENLRMGGYSLDDKSQLERPDRRDRGTLPDPQGTPRPACRHHVRRPAADAGHGPHHDHRPDIVMLDEPSLGLAPKIVQEMFDIMKMMAAEGITILLVEQNALMGLKNADWGVVLDLGQDAVRRAGR